MRLCCSARPSEQERSARDVDREKASAGRPVHGKILDLPDTQGQELEYLTYAKFSHRCNLNL